MDISFTELKDARQTGRLMHIMVNKYFADMAPYASLSLLEIYDKIKNIPYQADPPGMELIKRPKYTMQQIGAGGDCDCKAIALASWAKLNGIPYRFMGVGRKKPGVDYGRFDKINLTHVFPMVKIGNSWIIADATYSSNSIGQSLGNYDRIEILEPGSYARNQHARGTG